MVRGCAGSPYCWGGSFRSVLHGKAQEDVWISEMLQTDEIPREPTADNVIPPSDAENRWKRVPSDFSLTPAFYTSTSTHNRGHIPETQSTHKPVIYGPPRENLFRQSYKIMWFFSLYKSFRLNKVSRVLWKHIKGTNKCLFFSWHLSKKQYTFST